MRKYRRAIVIFAVAVMLLTAFVQVASAAEYGQFDIDVVYVIDVSGSMRQSDPDKLALTAANLFIDMCEGSDSRVGFVMYTHVIEAQQELTDLASFSKELKKTIAAKTYTSNGDTDTALGIETALEIFRTAAASGQNMRKPIIILLSDGNTDLPKGPRTKSESLAALEQAKQDAAQRGVPVYTIGFNFDGTMDETTMKQIAGETGGIARVTHSASELPGILRDIYGDLTGSKSANKTVQATGHPQSVTIDINDNSIYKTTITIMSSKPVKDISLETPSGTPAQYTVSTDPSGKYTLLTVFSPEKGEWVLNFTGTKDDVVSIDLLSIYDLALVLELPVTDVGKAEFSWHLEDGFNGQQITDNDLLDTIAPVLHASNLTLGKEYTENFQPGQTTMSAVLEAGDYEAYLALESGGIVRTSNTQMFSVPFAPEITLTPKVESKGNTYKVTLITILKKEKDIPLDEIVDYTRDNRPISTDAEPGDWDEVVTYDYDGQDETITVTAERAGGAEVKVTASDPHGHSVSFYIEATVISGLIPIIGAAVLILAVAAVVFLLKKNSQPRLSDPMGKLYIKMTMPASREAYTPPEDALALPAVKGKKTLREIINQNISKQEPYTAAFGAISWFADGLIIRAKTRTLLELQIPVSPGYSVRVERQEIASRKGVEMAADGSIEVRIGFSDDGEYDEYTIIFGQQNTSGPSAGGYYNDDDDFNTGGGGPQGAATSNDGFWD